MNKKLKKVMLLSMFLNIFSLLSTASFAEYKQYLEKQLDFTLVAEGNIDVEEEHLDFGNIVRGSTGDTRAETQIKVQLGDNSPRTVRASFRQKGEDKLEDMKTHYELTISRVENVDGGNKGSEKKAPLADADTGELNTLTVKLKNFDEKYEFQGTENDSILKIPLEGVISDVPENQMLGLYRGYVRVEIEIEGQGAEGGTAIK